MPFSSSHIMSYTQNNHPGFDFVTVTTDGSKRTKDMLSLHSQQQHSLLTDDHNIVT